MKQLHLVILLLYVSLFFQCGKDNETISRKIDFNEGWKFTEDSTIDASAENFDFSSWRSVDLPHDWSVENHPIQDSLHDGPFYKQMVGGHDAGWLRGGTGWYRKSFTLNKEHDGRQIYLHFDGVQSEMILWVNGKKVGNHAYGYTPFNFNITPYLKEPGEPNHLAIKVIKPEQNSRWFTGAGIYRNVTMSIVNPYRVDNWGVFVTTDSLTENAALLSVDVNLVNDFDFVIKSKIKLDLVGNDGKIEKSGHRFIEVDENSKKIERFDVELTNPELWKLSDPNLYTVVVSLYQGEDKVDEYRQKFGIRTIDFSAEKGFLLNGEPTLLKGGCMHHDNGLLGAAAFKTAEYRRVALMKNNGYNAIRTAHNPPSEYFLNACDELGVLVIDETFDMWLKPKRPNDYSNYYKEWWEKDTRAMVMRDRNHPSVIMWSIGNEIQERADSSGLAIAKAAYNFIKNMDDSRPVTQALCGFWDNPGKEWDESAPAFAQMDVGGYNYQHQNYEKDHAKYPDRIMYGSETVAQQAFENWSLVEKHPYIIGDFVWTSMDYLGEATVGKSMYKEDAGAELPFHMPWPWYQANCGDIDLIGNKKPQSYYKDVLWGESRLEMAVHEPIPEGKHEVVFFWGWPKEHQSWDWQGHEQEDLKVNVYSRYSKVKLVLNDITIGEKEIKEQDRLTATFSVPYQPGVLKVYGIENGAVADSSELITTNGADKLKLEAERSELVAGRQEIVFVDIKVVDDRGRWVPLDSSRVQIETEGEGELIAAGNASPFAHGSLQDHSMKLYDGKGLLVIRSSGSPGQTIVTANSDGLTSGKLIIQWD